MPITKSAKKAIRGSAKKRGFNERNKRAMKETMKTVEKLAKAGEKDAGKALSSAFAAIDKAAKRRVIKKNTAASKKSRLSKIMVLK